MYYAYHFFTAKGVLVRTGFTSDIDLRKSKLQRKWPDGYVNIEREFDGWMDALDWENRMRRAGYPTETPHNPVKEEKLTRLGKRRHRAAAPSYRQKRERKG